MALAKLKTDDKSNEITADLRHGHCFGIPSVTGNFPVTLRAGKSGSTGSARLDLTINPNRLR